jgi:hypothetical protein
MASASPLQPTPYAALLRWRLELRGLRDAAQYRAGHLSEALKKIPVESPLHRGLSAESYEADCKLAALSNELSEVRRQLRIMEKKSGLGEAPPDPHVKVPERVSSPEREPVSEPVPEPAPEPVVAAKPEPVVAATPQPPPLPDYVVRGALEPQRDRSTAEWLEALRARARKEP